MVLSLRSGLNSLETRPGADIIPVPSEVRSKANFQNMSLLNTTGAFYMSSSSPDRTIPRFRATAPERDTLQSTARLVPADPEFPGAGLNGSPMPLSFAAVNTP